MKLMMNWMKSLAKTETDNNKTDKKKKKSHYLIDDVSYSFNEDGTENYRLLQGAYVEKLDETLTG